MNPTSLMQSLGSIGLFPTRVFLPAFISALLLRFGPQIPFLHHLGLLSHLHHTQPTWFTNNITLAVLGILSALEIAAQKNAEARNVLHEFDVWGKAALAALTSFGVISSTDSQFVQQVTQHAGYLDMIPPLIAALGTLKVSRARKGVVMPFFDHVQGTHLAHLASWLEEAWAAFGVLLLFLFPLLMLLTIGIGIGILYMIRRRMQRAEEQSKRPCPGCGTLIYPCAMACPSCRTANANPAALGFLGLSQPYPTGNVADHPYRLTEKRRCSLCATRLRPRRPFDPCPACGELKLADPTYADAYDKYIRSRLPLVLMVCVLMSFVPILGLIVGTIYYRMELVLPFSQYLPLTRGFLLRWMIRLLFIVLVFLQIIPVVGGVVVPLMAFISYAAYSESFRGMVSSREPAPLSTAGLTPSPSGRGLG